MPVTELAWIPSATPGSIPPEFVEASRRALSVQGEWARKHASSLVPRGSSFIAGAAVYQQRQDPGVTLITAHWDSVAQHTEQWIESVENKTAIGELGPLVVPSDIRFFHVEGVEMFPAETLAQRYVSVLRFVVDISDGSASKKKGELERKWEDTRALLERESAMTHRGGWRIEKHDLGDERDEFVVIGAWNDEAALERFVDGTWCHADAWNDVWRAPDLVLSLDVTTYEKIM